MAAEVTQAENVWLTICLAVLDDMNAIAIGADSSAIGRSGRLPAGFLGIEKAVAGSGTAFPVSRICFRKMCLFAPPALRRRPRRVPLHVAFTAEQRLYGFRYPVTAPQTITVNRQRQSSDLGAEEDLVRNDGRRALRWLPEREAQTRALQSGDDPAQAKQFEQGGPAEFDSALYALVYMIDRNYAVLEPETINDGGPLLIFLRCRRPMKLFNAPTGRHAGRAPMSAGAGGGQILSGPLEIAFSSQETVNRRS